MTYFSKQKKSALLGLSSLFVLAACNSGSDIPVPPPAPPPPPPPSMVGFEVTVSNLTNAQPLSPVAVIAHQEGYAVFQIGSPATAGLELLAEGGDNTDLLAEADADSNAIASASGSDPIGPGNSETIAIEFLEADLSNARLSTSTMLVNTNDAITGINQLSLSGMSVGDVITQRGVAYDAGTEANTERAAHIPGPAGGGEGFNATRDDRADQVTMHIGVISQDDGLLTSDLTDQHRFDNPVIQVRVERTQ